jgi:hypothetical protein
VDRSIDLPFGCQKHVVRSSSVLVVLV